MTAGVDLPFLRSEESDRTECDRCKLEPDELGWYDSRIHCRCPHCGRTWLRREGDRDPLPQLPRYIQAAWVRVGCSPEVVNLPPDGAPMHLETLQGLVGGYLECLRDIWPGVDAWINEEGRLISMPPNRFVFASDGRAWGEVLGNIAITRHDDQGGVIGLTRADLRRIAQVFRL